MALLKPWVESEHVIGMWKAWLPWLFSILMIMKQSTQEHDLSLILEVIDACVITSSLNKMRRFQMNE